MVWNNSLLLSLMCCGLTGPGWAFLLGSHGVAEAAGIWRPKRAGRPRWQLMLTVPKASTPWPLQCLGFSQHHGWVPTENMTRDQIKRLSLTWSRLENSRTLLLSHSHGQVSHWGQPRFKGPELDSIYWWKNGKVISEEQLRWEIWLQAFKENTICHKYQVLIPYSIGENILK